MKHLAERKQKRSPNTDSGAFPSFSSYPAIPIVSPPALQQKSKQIVGVTGSALVGRDPFHPRAWSGSSRFFFETCQRNGILSRAFGVDVSRLRRMFLLGRNLSFPRERWRQAFYLDTLYYKWVTQQLAGQFQPDDFQHDILQIGGIYNVPRIVGGRARCFSYHDGNIAQLMASPHFQSLNLPSRLVKRAFAYEQEVYASLDRIFTMSDYLRRSFVHDFGVAPDRVVTIGAGVNLEEIPPRQFHKDYSLQNILFIGVDFARKGGMPLLEAFRAIKDRLPGATLHIVGPRELSIPPALRRGVEFHGFLNKQDPAQRARLERLFFETSVFVLPSLYEPFGIAPLEAMLHEIPCALSNAWAFPEMVEPGWNGDLFEVGNADDIAETLITLLRDPNKLKEMGQNGRSKVMGHYTWEHVARRLEHEIRR